MECNLLVNVENRKEESIVQCVRFLHDELVGAIFSSDDPNRVLQREAVSRPRDTRQQATP